MTLRSKYLIPIILLLSAFNTVGWAQGNELLRFHYQNYLFQFSPRHERIAWEILQAVKKNDPRLQQFYGIVLTNPVRIRLVDSEETFSKELGTVLPGWVAAVYQPHRNRILIKPNGEGKSLSDLKKDVLHELSHAYFQEKFKGRKMPLWFNEGLAEYLAGKRINLRDGLVLSNALFAKKIVPLAKIDSLLTFSYAKARLGYLESLSAILFLENTFIKAKTNWSWFLNRITRVGFAPALRELTGLDTIDFEVKWYRWLHKRYRWLVILNLENLIWLLMIIILVGSLYAIRYRNRKVLAQWELQEQLEPEIDWTSEDESDFLK